MQAAELRLLTALHEATRRNALRWSRADDDERDIYLTEAGESQLRIEFVYVSLAVEPLAGCGIAERFVARFSGLGVYFQVAIGTQAYDMIEETLDFQIHGWAEGRARSLKDFARATERIRALIPAHPEDPA